MHSIRSGSLHRQEWRDRSPATLIRWIDSSRLTAFSDDSGAAPTLRRRRVEVTMLDHAQAEHSSSASAPRPGTRESHHESLEPQLGAIPVSSVSPGRGLLGPTVADDAADPQDRLRYLRRSHHHRLPSEEQAESSDHRTADRLGKPIVAALRRSNGGAAVSPDVGSAGDRQLMCGRRFAASGLRLRRADPH